MPAANGIVDTSAALICPAKLEMKIGGLGLQVNCSSQQKHGFVMLALLSAYESEIGIVARGRRLGDNLPIDLFRPFHAAGIEAGDCFVYCSLDLGFFHWSRVRLG